MKDTPQLHNTEDIMVWYEELTFLVSQLNNDAPKIKKMYTTFEQTVSKQEAIVGKSIQAIDTATTAAIIKLQKESKAVLDAAAHHLAKAELVSKRCEDMLSKVEMLAKNMESAREHQLAVDKRLIQLEAKLQAVGSGAQIFDTQQTRRESDGSNARIIATNTTLRDFFKANGFRVIDHRAGGGALWVVGTETTLKPYVDHAKKHFKIKGQYGSGRATNSKPGWWTKDDV